MSSGLERIPGIFSLFITSQLPNADFPLQDWRSAGLNVPSGVKGQICTVEERLVRKVTGRISTRDAFSLSTHLREWLGL